MRQQLMHKQERWLRQVGSRLKQQLQVAQAASSRASESTEAAVEEERVSVTSEEPDES